MHRFLEHRTAAGKLFERFSVLLILANVITFILSTNPAVNDQWRGAFNAFEAISVAVFSAEYLARVWSVVEDQEWARKGRLAFIRSFYSLIDLLSTVPFYIDLLLPGDALPASQFLRIFRLFRLLKSDRRMAATFSMFDDIVRDNLLLIKTSSFVGFTCWVHFASLYWLAERHNPLMEGKFDSIASSMYFTLINLCGEYPLADAHSPWGRVVGTMVGVVGVAVFAIPTGIFGSGLEDRMIPDDDGGGEGEGGGKCGGPQQRSASRAVLEGPTPLRASRQYHYWRLLNAKSESGKVYEVLLFLLIALNVVAFILSTEQANKTGPAAALLGLFELISVGIFSGDYLLRLWAAGAEPAYAGLRGRLRFATTFFATVDLVSVAPYYVGALLGDPAAGSFTFLRAFRLIRLLKAEQHLKCFSAFGGVVAKNRDILAVTGLAAAVMWVFFSALLYFTERENPLLVNPDGLPYFGTVFDSM